MEGRHSLPSAFPNKILAVQWKVREFERHVLMKTYQRAKRDQIVVLLIAYI